MDAVKFLKRKDRMCKSFNDNCKNKDGNNFCCGLRYEADKSGESCEEYISNHPTKAVEIVERWAKEHPAKTRQDIYLEEQIPSSLKKFVTITPKVDSNGALDLCPADVFCEPDCKLGSNEGYKKSTKEICDECRKAFWLREVE